MRDSFILYMSHCDILTDLTDAQVGIVMKNIFNYIKNGCDNPIEDATASVAYKFLKNQITVDAEKYERASEAGRKGGAPKGNQNARKNNLKQPKTTTPCFENNLKQPNDNVNDNDNVNNIYSSLDNNINNNIYINNNNTEIDIYSFIDNLKTDDEVKSALTAYAKEWEARGRPLTPAALEVQLKQLISITTDPKEQVKIIKLSIAKRWNGFFKDKYSDSDNGEMNSGDFLRALAKGEINIDDTGS